ncbi:hypothetical protein OG21DRAFT_1487409 [Imleria badia]|nr:hypothetical protein OG21DRAFT_1487409 [Imleria badia]
MVENGREHIPAAVLEIEGVPALLYGAGGEDSHSNSNTSTLAHSIIKCSSFYQSKASGPRLGVARVPNLSLQKANNLTATYRAEQKQKKEDAARPPIRIAATLWDLPEKRGEVRGKMIQISQIRVMGSYDPGTSIKDDLGDLLLQVGREFKKESPRASSLNWGNVSIYAHESPSKHSNIDEEAMDGTAQAFFDLFVKRGWGAQVNLKAKLVEVRFVYRHEEICLGDSDANYCESVGVVAASLPSRKSKPKRKARALIVDSDGEPDELDSRPVRKSKPPPTLFSAFRPPRLNVRDPPLVNHGFTRTTAVYQEDGTVVFLVSEAEEEIEIAGDWQVGQRANKDGKPFWNTGYIGEGYTKTAIYARFKGKDYVLTQLTQKGPEDHHYSEDENEAHLKVEYERLCQGDGIKVHFDKHAKDCKANTPGTVTIPPLFMNHDACKADIASCTANENLQAGSSHTDT